MTTKKSFAGSTERMEKSRRFLPGGVSSGLRSVSKPLPLFFASGTGSRLVDVDGNEFIDYTLAWGPLILGHCPESINQAIMRQLQTLQQVGAQHDLEWQVAEQICRIVPSAERVIFSNTGTEAVQVAFRLARAYTGRRKILRFEGHYHGWMDNVLVGYRPTLTRDPSLTATMPTEGMSELSTTEILTLPWNDLAAVEILLRESGHEIAAIITEPILCNSGCLLPLPGFLEGLRELSTRYGVVLIFDEVITGFRVSPGGAQSLFGVTPDLTTFGKAIAGGFVMSAVAGREELLGMIEERRVVHAGTFNGNPISLAASKAVLDVLESNSASVLEGIRSRGESLIEGIRMLARRHNIPVLINGVGSVFNLFFSERSTMRHYRDTLDADQTMRDQFIVSMLEQGIYLLPDGRWYLSSAHSLADIETTLAAIDQVFKAMAGMRRSTDSEWLAESGGFRSTTKDHSR